MSIRGQHAAEPRWPTVARLLIVSPPHRRFYLTHKANGWSDRFGCYMVNVRTAEALERRGLIRIVDGRIVRP